MRVLFITEGNSEVGYGHVYRCLALAEELERNSGVAIRFNLPTADKGAGGLVQRYGVVLGLRRHVHGDVCVVDLHAPEDRSLGEPQITLVDSLDDWIEPRLARKKRGEVLGSGGYVVAMLPSRKYQFMERPPPPGQSRHRHVYYGSDYAILARHILEAKPCRKQYDVTLCFGGADPAGATWLAAEALKDSSLKVVALLGLGFKGRDRFANEYPRFDIPPVASNPGPFFLSSQVALTSGGMTLWEALHLGCPTVVISQNTREEDRVRALAGGGYCIHMGQPDRFDSWHLAEVIQGLLANDPRRAELSARGAALVDGAGAARVARLVLDAPRPRGVSAEVAPPAQSVQGV